MAKQVEHTINSYLSFRLGEEVFATHVTKVLNILELVKITKIPDAPSYMRGVINLRGSVLPVVDTRLKFGLNRTENTSKTCIVVMDVSIEGEKLQLGALVDEVVEVLEIKKQDIQAPPSIGRRYHSEYIDGMLVQADGQFVILLDVDKVFSAEEVVQIREHIELEVKEE